MIILNVVENNVEHFILFGWSLQFFFLPVEIALFVEFQLWQMAINDVLYYIDVLYVKCSMKIDMLVNLLEVVKSSTCAYWWFGPLNLSCGVFLCFFVSCSSRWLGGTVEQRRSGRQSTCFQARSQGSLQRTPIRKILNEWPAGRELPWQLSPICNSLLNFQK